MSTHCAAERRPLDTMRQRSHFRNRRCLAKCRRRLGRAFALKPAEEATSITLQIGGRGSRHQRPLPDRPPTLQAFRSVLCRTPSVSTQRLINGSRSYPRCHGVQSRGAPLSYHKPPAAVYPKFSSCRVDFKSGIFVESKSGKFCAISGFENLQLWVIGNHCWRRVANSHPAGQPAL